MEYTFFTSPYDWLFAHKFMLFSGLLSLTILGLAADLLLKKKRDLRETFANITIFIANNSVNLFLAQAMQLAVLSWIDAHAPVHLPTNALTLGLCILGVDFCYYWRHRWEHEINILWAEHSVHHSSEEYNFSTSIRLPIIGPLMSWIFFTPLALIGFPAKLIIASYILDLLYQYWVHNGSVGKLGWLENILSTPSNHRVHHARNPRYLDKNYGGILIVWDKLFGTYEPETEKAEFGLVTPIATQHPITINTRPFVRLYEKVNAQKNIAEKFRVVFGRP